MEQEQSLPKHRLEKLSSTVGYCLKVWLTSVFASPMMMYITDSATSHMLSITLVMILLGGFMSFPSAFALYFMASRLLRKVESIVAIKVLLTIAGILLTLVPFWVIEDFHLGIKDLDLIGPYTFTIVFGIWIYKLKRI